jgi:hypothetical protein
MSPYLTKKSTSGFMRWTAVTISFDCSWSDIDQKRRIMPERFHKPDGKIESVVVSFEMAAHRSCEFLVPGDNLPNPPLSLFCVLLRVFDPRRQNGRTVEFPGCPEIGQYPVVEAGLVLELEVGLEPQPPVFNEEPVKLRRVLLDPAAHYLLRRLQLGIQRDIEAGRIRDDGDVWNIVRGQVLRETEPVSPPDAASCELALAIAPTSSYSWSKSWECAG